MRNNISFSHLKIVYKSVLYAVVPSFAQKFFKALDALRPQDDLSSGTFAGAGFGIAEVIFIMSLSPFVSLVSVIECATAAMFHISSTTIVLHGKTRNCFWLSYVTMALLHTFIDSIAVLYALTGRLSVTFMERFATLIAASLFIIALVLKNQKKRKISATRIL